MNILPPAEPFGKCPFCGARVEIKTSKHHGEEHLAFTCSKCPVAGKPYALQADAWQSWIEAKQMIFEQIQANESALRGLEKR